jgi:hypothetical protein
MYDEERRGRWSVNAKTSTKLHEEDKESEQENINGPIL